MSQLRGVRSHHVLHRQRHSHAAADAESGDTALGLALQHFVQQRHGNATSCAADRMPQRNRAAIHVQLVVIEIQLAVASQYLCRKGFV